MASPKLVSPVSTAYSFPFCSATTWDRRLKHTSPESSWKDLSGDAVSSLYLMWLLFFWGGPPLDQNSVFDPVVSHLIQWWDTPPPPRRSERRSSSSEKMLLLKADIFWRQEQHYNNLCKLQHCSPASLLWWGSLLLLWWCILHHLFTRCFQYLSIWSLLTPTSISTSSLWSTIQQSMEYIKEQKNSSTVIESLKIFSIQKKTIFWRESLFIAPWRRLWCHPTLPPPPESPPQSPKYPLHRQLHRLSHSGTLRCNRSASEISSRCHFFATKLVGYFGGALWSPGKVPGTLVSVNVGRFKN